MVEVERLRRLPLFEDLDHHDLATVAHHVGEVEMPSGRVLFEQGSLPYELFVVEEGAAEITKDGRTIGTIGAGDVVGEMGMLRLQRRTATVTVTEPLRAVTVSADDLAALEATMPEIGAQLRSIMAGREAPDPSAGA
jgi:CRP-like cAMP-binding protein